MFLSSADDISPTDSRSPKGFGNHRKAMAVLGGSDSNHQSKQSPPQSQNRTNSTAIAPWDTQAAPSNTKAIAPWDTQAPSSNKAVTPWDDDPQAQLGGVRPFGQSHFNEVEPIGQPSPSARPSTGKLGTADSPDLEPFDARRPSVASATTVSSQGSKSSSTGARFQKSLKSFFGDDPQSDSRKASQTNLPEQERNGKDMAQTKARNDSVKTQNTIQEAPRPQTPVPSRDVTPWSFQEFSDVSRYGDAPVHEEPLEGSGTANSNGSAPAPAPAAEKHHRSLLHRHTRSKEEAPKNPSLAPTSNLQRPMTSRDSSRSNVPLVTSTPRNTTPMSSTSALGLRGSSPTPGSRSEHDKRSGAAPTEKRSIFSKVLHRHKEKPPQPEPIRTSNGPTRPIPEIPEKNKAPVPEPMSAKRTRESSVATSDSGSTIKPAEPFPKIDRTFTASSKVSSKFGRHAKNRGMSYQGQAGDAVRQEQQTAVQAGIFNLDTNLDDMSDIIAQPIQPKSPDDPNGIFTGLPKGPQTPAVEITTPAWDAPDSWDVKEQKDDILSRLPEIDEGGMPAIEEDDGTVYFMRVFRTDSTFATLSTGINTTVADILQMLAKKSVLHDSINNYQLLLRKHDLSRELEAGERPIAMQKKLLEQAGYEPSDGIEEIGREDNSYLCRFTFSHEKQTGYGSGLDKDPAFNKMQKFSHVDLQGRSLVTIPIILYTKAPEIISLNLSRNLALKVPKDFIQACINLREIKFTGNEAWRLPTSLTWASRLTVLDISNNRLESLLNAELDRLTSLVSLRLANNLLTELPPYVQKFRSLRSLNLSSNNLKAFPELITNLRSLVDLDISFNKLTALPKIGNLITLERLWVTNNELKGPFDETWKNLINLKEIDARFNGITNIDNVAALPKLEQLLVGHNGISTFKGSFARLRTLVLDHCPMTSFDLDAPVPTLTTLNIASANLVELKDTIFDFMPNLQKLNLDKNRITNMSVQIGRLARLEHFSMAKNPLSLVPPSIGNLTDLKFLNLRECNIKSVPPELWYCLKLETLNLSSNVLETFPKQNAAPPPTAKDYGTPATTPSLSSSPSFEELGKLEDFQARRPSQASGGMLGNSPSGSQRKGSIASMYSPGPRKPSVISRTATETSMSGVTRKDSNISQARLTNTFAGSLRYLYLADNRLEDDVFNELAKLPELRSLNLSYNELNDVPQGLMSRWPNLTELFLSGNELTSLPSDDLQDTSNLRVLHINGNRFQVLPAELCKVPKLAVLDVGSNSLKYNVSNWPYDWNWNFNNNLKYLNFSGNKRLEIKPMTQHQFNAMQSGSGNQKDLSSFTTLNFLRILGLMDVTLTISTSNVPDESEDRRVRTSASVAGAITYGMADTLGKQEHLSIADMLVSPFRGQEAEVLVGMFEGQSLTGGGSKIAKYLHENFRMTFEEEMRKLSPTDSGPTDALRRTFLSLNKDMAAAATRSIDVREQRMNSIHRGSTVAQVLNQDDINSGGVATILYLNNSDLFVANVGDAQALLIQANAQWKWLTRKHDPANEPRERERIREAGGYVSRQGKLNDVLEVSRAFGYFQMMPCVIAAPHTIQVKLNDSDELIILASREFWEYVTPDLAIDVARSEKSDLMIASQRLRDLAMAYGAKDKMMVMVLGISDLRKRNNNRFRGTSLSMAKEFGQEDNQIFPSSRKTRRKGETLVGDSRLARLDEPEAPIGEVAIVFTDIKNSTALWEILPIAMRSSIQIHNELFRRQLRLIGGYEVKTEGDAFMVSFPTVTSALLWCFSCQSHLLECSWPTEILDTVHCQERLDTDGNTIYRGLSVRMGIHWGKPVCEPDPITRRMDYFGPMVNRAARISAVADGGQISVSSDYISELQRTLEAFAEDDRRNSVDSQDTVNEDPRATNIRKELSMLSSQGFEVKDLGEKKLKGLENPESIYLIYPHSLAGRLSVSPLGDKAAEGGSGDGVPGDPGTLGKESELSENLKTDDVWLLWDLALRLEMLCSCLENPEKAATLKKPELSLLDRMKNQGGEITDKFMMNLLEHQVTRIEVSCHFWITCNLLTLTVLHKHLTAAAYDSTLQGGRQVRRSCATDRRSYGAADGSTDGVREVQES
jgi:adenylate cyclase